MKVKRILSLVVLIAYAAQEGGWAQLLEKPAGYEPTLSNESVLEDGFVDLTQLEQIAAEEKLFDKRLSSISNLRLDAEKVRQLQLQENLRVLDQVTEVKKIQDQQQNAEMEGKARSIQNKLARAGEQYVLYDDGKKITFKAGLAIRIENEPVRDKLGNESVRQTLNMVYNDRNQLIGYEQQVADSLGNVTRVDWREGTYWTKEDQLADSRKVAGKLSGYYETVYEPTGRVVESRWRNLRYYTQADEQENPRHVEGQLAGYRRSLVSNDAAEAERLIEFSDAVYLRRPATPTESDPSKEDDLLLTSFHEKVTLSGITTERDFYDAQYNEHEQLISYKEDRETPGIRTRMEWQNGKYDSLGRLTAFDEVSVTNGIRTERHFRDGKYNDTGQLVSYTETVKTSGSGSVTHYSGLQYDEVGRLRSSTEEITENGISFTRRRNDIEYDGKGRITGYLEVEERQDGVTETLRSNISYDVYGRVAGYEDKVRETKNGQTRSYDLLRIYTEYDQEGRPVYYIEEVRDSSRPGQTVLRERNILDFNSEGRPVHFTEKETVRDERELTTIRERYGIEYNEKGEEQSYWEKFTDPAGRTTVRHLYNIVTDPLGRMVSYVEELYNPDGFVSILENKLLQTTTREITVYNDQNQILYSKEKVVQAQNPNHTVTIEFYDPAYDHLNRLTAYTESVAGGRTRQFFDIVYDKLDRIVSQKFIDSGLSLRFGNVNTQTFVYDQTTGELIEYKIENPDFIATYDPAGNQKAFDFSPQMKAFIAEEKRKAREAAERRAREEAEQKAEEERERSGRRVIRRTETTVLGGGDVQVEVLATGPIENEEVVVTGPVEEEVVLAVDEVRIVEVVYEEEDVSGITHTVKEVSRFGSQGNLIELRVEDNYQYRNGQGKKVTARVVSLFDSNRRLIQTGETYKTKVRGGEVHQKRTIWYGPGKSVLRVNEDQEFKESGFFASSLGKLVKGAVNAAVAFFTAGNPLALAATNFGFNLAQGHDTEDAFVSSGISLAANLFAVGASSLLKNVSDNAFGGFGQTISSFGENLSHAVSPSASAASAQQATGALLSQVAMRAGTDAFADSFGDKLGAFGTAAALAAAAGLSGSYLQSGASPISPEHLASLAIRALAQGGVAEAFKNQTGPGAQFAREVSSLAAAGLDTQVLGEAIKPIKNGLAGVGSYVGELKQKLSNNPTQALKEIAQEIKKYNALAIKSGFENPDPLLAPTPEGILPGQVIGLREVDPQNPDKENFSLLGDQFGQLNKGFKVQFVDSTKPNQTISDSTNLQNDIIMIDKNTFMITEVVQLKDLKTKTVPEVKPRSLASHVVENSFLSGADFAAKGLSGSFGISQVVVELKHLAPKATKFLGKAGLIGTVYSVVEAKNRIADILSDPYLTSGEKYKLFSAEFGETAAKLGLAFIAGAATGAAFSAGGLLAAIPVAGIGFALGSFGSYLIDNKTIKLRNDYYLN